MRSVFIAGFSLALSGCANHPLVDDKTGYTTYDIINKVRCEAAQRLWEHLGDAGWANFKVAADATFAKSSELQQRIAKDKDLISAKAELARVSDDLARVKRKLEWFEREVEARDFTPEIADQLNNLIATRAEKFDELKPSIASFKKDPNLLGNKALDQAISLAEAIVSLDEKIKLLERLRPQQADEHDELAKLAKELVDTVKTISNKIEKHPDVVAYNKIKAIIDADDRFISYERFKKTSIAFQFRFDIHEKNNALASGSVKFPVHLGAITIGYNAGMEKTRKSERAVGIQHTFGGLLALKSCVEAELVEDGRARIYPITGNVGMSEFVAQFLKVTRDLKKDDGEFKLTSSGVSFGNSKLFADKLTFTTKLTAGVEPALDLSPTPAHRVVARLDYDAERQDVHEVTVEIAPPNEGGSSPVLSYGIANVPEIGVRLIEDSYGRSPGPSLHRR